MISFMKGKKYFKTTGPANVLDGFASLDSNSYLSIIYNIL